MMRGERKDVQRDPENEEGRLIRRCLAPDAGNALEVGCGDGRLTVELARIADTLVAVDFDVKELTSARGRVERPIHFVAASGESLPLTTNCMDSVVFTLSLHHQDSVKALGEARRVLRDNGRILVLEPEADCLLSRLFAVLDDESEQYEWTAETIARSGLEELDSGFVRNRWVFADFAEMVCYLFDYFGLEPDRENESRMAALVADRQESRPLSVGDVTRFWLLRKGTL